MKKIEQEYKELYNFIYKQDHNFLGDIHKHNEYIQKLKRFTELQKKLQKTV